MYNDCPNKKGEDMCEYSKVGICEVHSGCNENGIECEYFSIFGLKSAPCNNCSGNNCNYEAPTKLVSEKKAALTELEIEYPNHVKAAPAMIKALEAVLGSYVLFTSSANETPDMKRARTLIGMALDEARGL
jgi:hypothetical protein